MSTPYPTYCEFVEEHCGVRLTDAQRLLCAVAFDGAEPSGKVGEAIFGQLQSIPEVARETVCAVCGARAGKTLLLVGLRMLYLALTVSIETLAPGEQAVALIVAPDMRLARQALRYVSGAVTGSPTLSQALAGEPTADVVRLYRENGEIVTVECLPATRGGAALRGRSLVGAALDECAFFRDETFQVNDVELYKAVSPRILPGGQIVIASTPWAEAGLLWKTFQDNHGMPRYALAAHAPTMLLRNDAHTRAHVDRERSRDPENAAREFDAVFMGTGADAFFDARAIDRAVDPALELGADVSPGWQVTFGADFGFARDSSALVAVHIHDGRRTVADLLELRPEPGKPLSPREVVRSFAEMVERHRGSYVMADAHYREAIQELLNDHDLGLIDAPTAPAEAYVVARTLLHGGLVRLPRHPRLLAQLREVRARRTSGGAVTIIQPRKPTGGHGDLVSALVLALYQAAGDEVKPPGLDPETVEGYGPAAMRERRRREVARAHSDREQSRWWASVPGRRGK